MHPRILVLSPLPAGLVTRLESRFEVIDGTNPERCLSPDELAEVRGIACTGAAPIDEELLRRLPNLEIISSFSAGLDRIDLEAAKRRGVIVTNTSPALAADVADIAIALILMLSRRLGAAERFVRRGDWLQGAFPLAKSLYGARLGVFGLGTIGAAAAERARAFGLEVLYSGRKPKPVPFAYRDSIRELARDSDFLLMTCASTAETYHIVQDEVLDALGPGGFLVNVSRGAVVDEFALVRALKAGRIAGAGLDVFENEPAVPHELLELDNVVLLPHLGSGTHETREAMADLTVRNLTVHFEGGAVLSPVT